MSRPIPRSSPRRVEPGAPLAGYSVREAAELVGVSEARVRAWLRAGVIATAPLDLAAGSPRRTGGARLSFQDLVLLRTAKELAVARVPARRIRYALERLREQLPQGRPLSAVRILADGARVVARDEAATWIPESGQALFDFAVEDLARVAAPFARARAERLEAERELSAEDWYRLGCELEETDPGAAARAYRSALEREPDHADAELNLGRLEHQTGDPAAALPHYHRALAARPGDSTATFNLGVALEDLGRYDEAAAIYRDLLEHDPEFLDAHYNLAGVAERLGARAEAIRHLSAYKTLRERHG